MKWFSSLIALLCAAVSVQAYTSVDENFSFVGYEDFAPLPSALIQGEDGNLYGTNPFGPPDSGSVFQVTLEGDATFIHHFIGDGAEPAGGLVQVPHGDLYGVVSYGPSYPDSAIFRISPEGTVTYIYQFTGGDDGGSVGDVGSSLVLGNDRQHLYTSCYRGGASGNGTVVSVTLDGVLTVLHTFEGSDGSGPVDAPIQTPDGSLYGTAGGGPYGGGTLYKIDANGIFTVLHAFPQYSYPIGLLYGSDGNVYGGTTGGGDNGSGSIFKMTPEGVVTTLHEFSDGSFIYSRLIEADDGFIYGGTINTSGADDSIFRMDFAGNLTTLHTFIANGTSGALLQASDRNLYGSLVRGEIFKVTLQVPTLGNISTRMQVGRTENVLIGGFIITGTQPKKVIVRAIGPSLSDQGISNSLADPSLELHDGSGALIASNDNWQTTEIGGVLEQSQVADIQSSGLAPTNSAESAMIATLSPGAYTAIVEGSHNGTGVGLVEAYDLDSRGCHEL